jgi:two-component system, LytTR family, response regulator
MTETSSLRVLIADDEPIARATIEALVREDAELSVVHVCQDGSAALAALRLGGVDLALLDIEMPGLTGLDVIQELGAAAPPAVIFATAYDHFAVQAFEVRAVDYVLKPYDDDRLRAALVRAKTRLAEREAADRMGEGKITIHKEGRVEVIDIRNLVWVEAADQYVRLHTTEGETLMRAAMSKLEETLPPQRFVRVHRSAIVDMDRVVGLESSVGGGATLTLEGGQQAPVSRSRVADVRKRLG